MNTTSAAGQSLYVGLDIGSLSCEAVVLDEAGRMLAYEVRPTGARTRATAQEVLDAVLAQVGASRDALNALVATGYGRNQVPGDDVKTVTEITCHARGIRHLFPAVRLLLDVGGQDSKAIRLTDSGQVADFAMNDKCAAGTGRFFEVMARALEVDLHDLGSLALTATKRLSISHVCTVFAESEVVGMLADGQPVADIAAALCYSAAERAVTLISRVGMSEPFALSGGVAKNAGFVAALADLLGVQPLVPDEPQIVGALGAALLGLERAHGSNSDL